MKYILAIIACAVEGIVYAIIGAFLGWRSGGGVIPMMVLFALWGITWQTITKTKQIKSVGKRDESTEKQPTETD